MKTAISLPDDLFHAAERYREQQGKSRSQLYSEALSEYLTRHAPDEMTEAMDRVLGELDSPTPEPFVGEATRRILERSEW